MQFQIIVSGISKTFSSCYFLTIFYYLVIFGIDGHDRNSPHNCRRSRFDPRWP